jgi:hypothetical protein
MKVMSEYDSLGEQVALKIRKLNTHYAKEVMEHMINTTLFETSIGKYDHPAFPSFYDSVPAFP